ncbi:MAG: TRAP transporter small permease subunit [Rhizobiales bacterium]|nr:TRAP transporter small permease subunit [Hyphomicrobiales bacterium]
MQRFRRFLHVFVDLIGVGAFIAVFAAINVQVFMRYVAEHPVRWSEEFPTIAFSIAVLWSASFMLKEADHISFDLVVDLLPDWARRLTWIAANALIAALFAAALPAVIDFALYMKVLSSPILRIRYDFVFSFFALFIAASAVRGAYAAIREAWDWRSRIRGGAKASK